jgi:hypothetical protein
VSHSVALPAQSIGEKGSYSKTAYSTVQQYKRSQGYTNGNELAPPYYMRQYPLNILPGARPNESVPQYLIYNPSSKCLSIIAY